MNRNRVRLVLKWTIFPLAIGILGASMTMGSQALDYAQFSEPDSVTRAILEMRFWRTVTAFVVGGALALAGTIFQNILRNPLAEPFTLGLSGGAALGAASAFLLGIHASFGYAVPLCAFAGAVLVLGIVLSVSRGGRNGMEDLLLSGVIVGTLASSLLMLLVSGSSSDDLAGIVWWMLGDCQSAEPKLLIPGAGFLFASFLLARFFAGDINALSLGEDTAWSYGVSVRRTSVLLVVLASLLAAFSVAIAGIIGFCGLIVPHAVRRIFGADSRTNLWIILVVGGLFLVVCDTAARIVLRDQELPVGVITSFVGGPLFLFLLNRRPQTCDA